MRFSVVFNVTNKEIPIKFDNRSMGFDIAFGAVHTVYIRPESEYYDGEYSVTPTVDGLTVPTAHKYLEKDVTVNPITTRIVSNAAGGTTFYIATNDL